MAAEATPKGHHAGPFWYVHESLTRKAQRPKVDSRAGPELHRTGSCEKKTSNVTGAGQGFMQNSHTATSSLAQQQTKLKTQKC